MKQPEQSNVHTNPLPQHNIEGVNMIGAENIERDSNHKYLRSVGEYPQKSGTSILGWEYPKRSHLVEYELGLIKHQMNQLAELVVYQHQLTR